MKYFALLLLFSYMCSCNHTDENIIIKNLKTEDLNLLNGVSIEPRKKDDKKYVAYEFSKELNGQKFTLPNFKYYSDEQIKNTQLFDVMRYAAINNISEEKQALTFVRNYSDLILKTYENIGVYKIFSNNKAGEFIIFFKDDDDFIAYVPDVNKINVEFWKKKIKASKEIEPYWFRGKY